MTGCITGLHDWPRNKDTSPIFHSTEEAVLYAQLIYNRPDELAILNNYMDSYHIKLKDCRQSNDLNLELLIHLSISAQRYRACAKECERIKAETNQ